MTPAEKVNRTRGDWLMVVLQSEAHRPTVDVDKESASAECANEYLGRFLMVEHGSDRYDVRRWFTTWDTVEEAYAYHRQQECPDDWRPALFVDLDTGTPLILSQGSVAYPDDEPLTAWLDPTRSDFWPTEGDERCAEALNILRNIVAMASDGDEEHHYAEAFVPLFEAAAQALGMPWGDA